MGGKMEIKADLTPEVEVKVHKTGASEGGRWWLWWGDQWMMQNFTFVSPSQQENGGLRWLQRSHDIYAALILAFKIQSCVFPDDLRQIWFALLLLLLFLFYHCCYYCYFYSDSCVLSRFFNDIVLPASHVYLRSNCGQIVVFDPCWRRSIVIVSLIVIGANINCPNWDFIVRHLQNCCSVHLIEASDQPDAVIAAGSSERAVYIRCVKVHSWWYRCWYTCMTRISCDSWWCRCITADILHD